jgi:hypothetical protein
MSENIDKVDISLSATCKYFLSDAQSQLSASRPVKGHC